MANYDMTLTDENGNDLYPVTKEENVIGLTDKINNFVTTINTNISKLGTYTLLYSASASTGTKTLSQSITNFRYLYFDYQTSDAGGGTIFIPVNLFKTLHTNTATKIIASTDYLYCTMYYVNNTSFYIQDTGPGSNKTIKVYGVY